MKTVFYTFLILMTGHSAWLNGQLPGKLLLEKTDEPVEKAFTVLKPKGWIAEGGIVRWDPVTSGGAANAIEAKINFTLKSDRKGSVMIHWLPDIYYVDLSGSYVAGMFPEGSTYNGMPVLHKLTAPWYITQYLAPTLHQGAELEMVNSRELPEIVKLCQQLDPVKEMGCQYSAAVIDYRYTEDGIRYLERAFAIIQDMGPYTAGMWKNRNTVIVRAPESRFSEWEPVFREIAESVQLRPEWIEGELKGQMQRGNTMIRTMEDVHRIGEEMQKGHARTNAQINHQAYLYLTDQEDYLNPHTGEVERGTSQWDHRWIDDLGNVIYTDREEYNPNLDLELQMDGFRRSRVVRQ